MKKYVLFFFAMFTMIGVGCKKSSNTTTPTAQLGTGNLTLKATQKILTDSLWWSSTPTTSPHWQLQFSLNYFEDPGRNVVTFGQESSYGAPTFTNDSNDSFSLLISKGFTYLTITDDVAANSLTGFSTYYKIAAISSASITLVPVDPQQNTLPAPSFPIATLLLVKAKY